MFDTGCVMKTPNEYGVYEPDTVEEMARCGRSYAAVRLCQCEDGLYRYGLTLHYTYGGFGGSISDRCKGFGTCGEARDAATTDLLRRFPKAWASEPQSVHDELRDLKAQIERRFRQPSLFDFGARPP
jgi:hypothetical protein